MKLRYYLLCLLPFLAACGGAPTHVSQAVIMDYQQAGSLPIFTQFLHKGSVANRVAIIYFYADWCGPCKRFRAALPSEQVSAALQHATLIKVNVDAYDELASYYGVTAVPTFIKVDAQGKPLAKITSDKWGADEPAEIAPVMAKLVSSSAYDLK